MQKIRYSEFFPQLLSKHPVFFFQLNAQEEMHADVSHQA